MTAVLAGLDAHPPVAQPDEGATYAAKIDKAETRLDFAKSAAEVERQVRAMNSPGAWFEAGGERVRVLATLSFPGEGRGPAVMRSALAAATNEPQAADAGPRPAPGKVETGISSPGQVLDDHLTIACGSGAIRPTLVQRAGSRPMATSEFLRGFPIPPGTRLG